MGNTDRRGALPPQFPRYFSALNFSFRSLPTNSSPGTIEDTNNLSIFSLKGLLILRLFFVSSFWLISGLSVPCNICYLFPSSDGEKEKF